MIHERTERNVEAVLAHRPTLDAPEGHEQGCTDCGWGGPDTEDAFRDHMADLIVECIAEARREGAADALIEAADVGPSSTTTDQLWRIWLRDRATAYQGDV